MVPVDDSASEVEVETEPPEAEVTMDFMLWEAEVESKPAEDNLTLRHASAEAQQLLSRYRPKDDSAEWNDIELTLPDPPTPVSHSPQHYPHLSTLLTCALDTGRVFARDIRLAGEEDFGMQWPEFQASVEALIRDLPLIVEGDDVIPPDAAPVTLAGSDRLEPWFDAFSALRQFGIFENYLVDIRQWDVVDKTKEERLGQRMDTALINLMKILAVYLRLNIFSYCIRIAFLRQRQRFLKKMMTWKRRKRKCLPHPTKMKPLALPICYFFCEVGKQKSTWITISLARSMLNCNNSSSAPERSRLMNP